MTDQAQILDQAVVAELRESVAGDEAFVKELVAAYLDESPTHLEAVAAAAAAGDAAALVRPAHTLKSSSAAIGAMRLSLVSKELELAAREGRIDHSAVAAIQVMWSETVAALETAGLTD